MMHIPDQESRGHISPTKTYLFAQLQLISLLNQFQKKLIKKLYMKKYL